MIICKVRTIVVLSRIYVGLTYLLSCLEPVYMANPSFEPLLFHGLDPFHPQRGMQKDARK